MGITAKRIINVQFVKSDFVLNLSKIEVVFRQKSDKLDSLASVLLCNLRFPGKAASRDPFQKKTGK